MTCAAYCGNVCCTNLNGSITDFGATLASNFISCTSNGCTVHASLINTLFLNVWGLWLWIGAFALVFGWLAMKVSKQEAVYRADEVEYID